ncbi:MAG: enoyl-CoA hydratase [Myxococcales bacterium]
MTQLQVTTLDDGALWRVTLGGSKGNILDAALMAALRGVIADAAGAPALRAIVIEGEGRHFSFGASVEEHLPESVEGMLRGFHDLILAMVDSGVILLAAVRGQCLGGALELVTVCHRVFADETARLGQPEIALGVFAPVASVALPERVGRAHAEDLCLTGRSVTAAEALAMGLVDEIAGEPCEAALAWARAHLGARSASSLRIASRAVRASLAARLHAELPAMERLYLDALMQTADAVEGLTAFLAKRPPAWRNA